MLRNLTILSLAFLVSCNEPSRTESHKPSRDDITYVEESDPETNRAKKKGRDTIGQFIDERAKGDDQFYGFIKVLFRSPKDFERIEYMWVDLLHHNGDEYTGTLSSYPDLIEELKYGQTVDFSLDEIVDWYYVENGHARGAFTVKLIRSRLTLEERKKFDPGYEYSFE